MFDLFWKIYWEVKMVKFKEILNVIYCGGFLSVFKNVDYRGYCVIFKLCNDIEINFGLFIN